MKKNSKNSSYKRINKVDGVELKPEVSRGSESSYTFIHALTVLLSGAAIFISLSVLYSNTSDKLTVATPATEPFSKINLEKEDIIPLRVVIPKISVDLQVKEATVSEGTWQTYDDSASYGVGSSVLNKLNGMSVIFAHARAGMFSRLNDLSDGDSIYVLSKDVWYRYVVFKKIYVLPSDVSFLNEGLGRSLALFTCYGPDDEKRVVVLALFEKLESSK